MYDKIVYRTKKANAYVIMQRITYFIDLSDITLFINVNI